MLLTYAVDIAKSVFHVHWVEPETGEIHNRKLSRAKFSAFIAQRQPGRIVMEACGSAHYRGVAFMALEPPGRALARLRGAQACDRQQGRLRRRGRDLADRAGRPRCGACRSRPSSSKPT